MIITFISDTHNKHHEITDKLKGGDIIIHSGDFSSMGYSSDLIRFLNWFSNLPYTEKIFIAGNHDFCFENSPIESRKIVDKFKNVTYLQDDFVYIGEHPNFIKIYGTPWQPRFFNWAFNIDRNSDELNEKWKQIPNDTDILITHCPPFGVLDKIKGTSMSLGCELLIDRINHINPKINSFGHIHTGYGYKNINNTHFINASVLNERYEVDNDVITIDWDIKNNIIKNFL